MLASASTRLKLVVPGREHGWRRRGSKRFKSVRANPSDDGITGWATPPRSQSGRVLVADARSPAMVPCATHVSNESRVSVPCINICLGLRSFCRGCLCVHCVGVCPFFCFCLFACISNKSTCPGRSVGCRAVGCTSPLGSPVRVGLAELSCTLTRRTRGSLHENVLLQQILHHA